MLEQIQELHSQHPISAIVAMPLHPKRITERGFNQSHEIAKHLAQRIGLPCLTKTCQRCYHRQPQVKLPLAARLRLPEDLFDCQADFDQQHIVLVDDVITTGLSLNRLAQAVKRQGTKEVSCCIVARAYPH